MLNLVKEDISCNIRATIWYGVECPEIQFTVCTLPFWGSKYIMTTVFCLPSVMLPVINKNYVIALQDCESMLYIAVFLNCRALASVILGRKSFSWNLHFSFLSIFHEKIFYSGNILRRIIFLSVSKSSEPEDLNNICVANISDQDFINPVIDN